MIKDFHNSFQRKENAMRANVKAGQNFDQRGDPINSISETSIDAQIINRVLEGFDAKDRVVSHAIKEFLNTHQEILKEKEPGEIIKRIESDEALDAVVQFHRALIRVFAAEFREKIANKNLGIASDNLKLKIEEFEEVDGDWQASPHRLLIVKKDNRKEEAAFRKIVEFAKTMADGTANISLQSIREGILPDDLIQSINQIGTNIREFIKDLADFLLEAKAEGHKEVLRICDDPDFTKEVAMKSNFPTPLRFLAAMILKFINKEV
jgi:hypothetical protein